MAYVIICIFLLLCITSIGLFVSGTYSTPTTGSMPTTQPTPQIISVPTTGSTVTTQPASGTATSDATNETTFMVLPQEVVVNVNDTFFVSVFAENVQNMYGWQIKLCFDPTIVECVNVSVPAQQVFSDKYPVSQALIDYNSTEFTKRPLQSIKNDEGYVLAGDCLLGQNQTMFNGSGFLCQVTFKAVSSGSSNLTLSTSNVQSPQTFYVDQRIDQTIPALSNSTVTVLP